MSKGNYFLTESNSYYHPDQESTSSNEEVSNHSSQDITIPLGTGRSYDCVFCKRGFDTAQALGGHMNIHRKHKARDKPNNSYSNTSSRRLSHKVIMPHASSSSSSPSKSNGNMHDHLQPLINPADWSTSLRSKCPLSELDHQEEKELDLELRLGYDS